MQSTPDRPRNPRHREVVRLLALGYSWEATAQLSRYSPRQIARIAKGVATYVETLRIELVDDLEREIFGSFALALDLERRVLSGEMDAQDARYQEARRLTEAIRKLFTRPV